MKEADQKLKEREELKHIFNFSLAAKENLFKTNISLKKVASV
jgi:hypothetical protein